jgi:predicted nucleic acid-binding protein
MEYGMKHAKDESIIKKMWLAIQSVKDEFQIVPLTNSGAKIFADLKEQYRETKNIGKKSLIKHNVDLIIAATAIEIGAILITNDTKDAIPIIIKTCRPDFDWEDWTG